MIGSLSGAFIMASTVLPFMKPISTIRLRKPPFPYILTITPRSPILSSESLISVCFIILHSRIAVHTGQNHVYAKICHEDRKVGTYNI